MNQIPASVATHLNRRNLKIGMLVGVLLVLIVATWLALLIPQYRSFRDASLSKAAVQSELAEVSGQLSVIDQLAATLSSVSEADSKKIDSGLPFGESLPEFVTNMHRLAERSGLVLTSLYFRPLSNVSPDGAPLETGGLRQSQGNIVVRGTYTSTFNFLSMLERHVRLIDVQSVGIASAANVSQGASSDPQLEMNIAATMYWLEPLPESPLFPAGSEVDAAFIESEQFKSLQILPPSTEKVLPNPF